MAPAAPGASHWGTSRSVPVSGTPAPKAASAAQPRCHVTLMPVMMTHIPAQAALRWLLLHLVAGSWSAMPPLRDRHPSPSKGTGICPAALVWVFPPLWGLQPGHHCSGDFILLFILAVGSRGADNDEGV